MNMIKRVYFFVVSVQRAAAEETGISTATATLEEESGNQDAGHLSGANS